jgi:hypothetical protein
VSFLILALTEELEMKWEFWGIDSQDRS